MKASKTVSLAKAIVVPYGIVLVLFLVFAVSVYSFAAKLHAEHKSLYRKAIYESAELVALFDDLQNIQSDVYKVINEKTQLVADNELHEINSRLSELFYLVQREKHNFIWNGYQATILDLLKAVDVFLAEVEKYVQKRNALIQRRFKNIQEIRYIGLYVNELVKNGSIENTQFLEPVHMILDDLFVLNADIPMYYSIKVYNRAEYWYRQLKEKAPEYKSEAVADIMQRVSQLMLEENKYTALFFELEELNNKETSLVIYLDSLSGQTAVVSKMLFDELQVTAEAQNTFMVDMMGYLSSFSIVIGLAAVVLIAVVYSFLTRHILLPVRDLRAFIKERTADTACSDIKQKITEVQDITCAVHDFVSQIEENEKSLRESHQSLEKQVQERTEEIRQLSEKILNVSEEERFKLAAELHDDIGSSIGTIKLGIEHALRLLNESDMGNARESLAGSVQIVKSVARQLRRIQTDLRPPHLDLGLLKTLEWYVEDYKNTHPTIQVQADFFFDELLLPTSLQIATFRIIQEGMNNVAKHSGATDVLLQVVHDENYVIIISDNGRGMQKKEGAETGHGLKNIRERVKVSGGEFHVESSDKGTSLVAKWKI